MSSLRNARSVIARPLAPTASFRPVTSIQQRAYAEKKNGAEPKILKDSPPDEKNHSSEVKEHNQEVDRRAERPAQKDKGEEVEKDKVPRGYWGGSEYTFAMSGCQGCVAC